MVFIKLISAIRSVNWQFDWSPQTIFHHFLPSTENRALLLTGKHAGKLTLQPRRGAGFVLNGALFFSFLKMLSGTLSFHFPYVMTHRVMP
jgi:hypothetical protein